MNVCEAYLLGALVGDGGLYSEKRGNGSTEYRVVWTSKDRVYLEAEIVPRIIEVMCSEQSQRSSYVGAPLDMK